jgi:DNA-binding NarL/FixJ family response regulator
VFVGEILVSSLAHDPVRVFAVDDHALVLDGLCRVIGADPRFRIVGSAATAPEALRALREVATDVVLIDLALGRGSGLDLVHALGAELPGRRCLVLTMHDPALYAERALRAGALGFVGKDVSTRELLEAILKVARGEVVLPDSVRSPMLLRLAGVMQPIGPSELGALTDREIEILRLLGEGLSTREIAARLGISVKTVETHRANVKAKLRITGLGELIRYAVEVFRREPPP